MVLNKTLTACKKNFKEPYFFRVLVFKHMHIIYTNNVLYVLVVRHKKVGASALAEPQRDDRISVPGIQHLRNPKHYQMRPSKKWRRAGMCLFRGEGRRSPMSSHFHKI